MSRFSHAVRITLAVAVIAAVAGAASARSAPQEPPGGSSAATMKTYTQVIPGTEIKFDLVPIPGGTFEMGAPSGEAKHGKDEEPQHTVQIEPFWMGCQGSDVG